MQKKDIKSMTLSELEQEFAALGEPRFRAKQIYEWMHGKQAEHFSDMTNLPKTLRERLEKQYTYTGLTVEKRLISAIDGTQKFLFGLSDKNVVESVWMRYQHGCSVCISSQVGCRMGCSFCASTLGGLVRNLTASEMLEQVYQIGRLTGERVSHVVVMGTGEPLDNYEALVRFLALISDEKGLHISQRNITVSTCGLTDQIRRLAGEKLQITLALSLHAPDQETRERLMPIAKRYDIHDAVKACEDYFACTGRRITYEYALIGGVNDTLKDARALAELIGGQNCHVNLIPLNPVKERRWVRSKQDAIAAFKNCLEKSGIPVTLRREMGKDIEGACGQLRRSVTAQF
ncbi:MAG: 23S rRNA (adenine(2503)-C(2))-methyltransferase RlmN [Clostridium sp.]|nr:23S rRNA (adenine(2503)-C(2))-methyltransferase RlmN [Clostridium sp.]